MNLPLEITQRVLNELASPADTGATRIILLSVANGGPARLSGKRRKYIFQRDNVAGAHVLDVPDSLWQHDLPKGPYRENLSICHDLQNVMGVKVPLVFIRIPWGDAASASPDVGALDDPRLPLLREFFTRIDAPPIVFEALDTLRDFPVEAFRDFLDAIAPFEINQPAGETGSEDPIPDVPQPPTAETPEAPEKAVSPAAIRMREMRQRKKLEKETGQPATRKLVTGRNPQPVQA